jgi:hypothetical protein
MTAMNARNMWEPVSEIENNCFKQRKIDSYFQNNNITPSVIFCCDET